MPFPGQDFNLVTQITKSNRHSEWHLCISHLYFSIFYVSLSLHSQWIGLHFSVCQSFKPDLRSITSQHRGLLFKVVAIDTAPIVSTLGEK